MPDGKDVRPAKWSDVLDLYDDGEYSAIWGRYDGHAHKCVGVRWNGLNPSLGYPIQGGHALWYVEPDFMTESVLESLRSQAEGRGDYEAIRAISKALGEHKQHMPVSHPLIYRRPPRRVKGFAWGAAVLLIATIIVSSVAWNQRDPTLVFVFGAIWAVVPPLWFWYEYFFVFRIQGEHAGFESFKYGQQLSVAIWAAVVLTLFAVASSERFKPDKPSTQLPQPSLLESAHNSVYGLTIGCRDAEPSMPSPTTGLHAGLAFPDPCVVRRRDRGIPLASGDPPGMAA